MAVKMHNLEMPPHQKTGKILDLSRKLVFQIYCSPKKNTNATRVAFHSCAPSHPAAPCGVVGPPPQCPRPWVMGSLRRSP